MKIEWESVFDLYFIFLTIEEKNQKHQWAELYEKKKPKEEFDRYLILTIHIYELEYLMI